jgi:hypothetical protein
MQEGGDGALDGGGDVLLIGLLIEPQQVAQLNVAAY